MSSPPAPPPFPPPNVTSSSRGPGALQAAARAVDSLCSATSADCAAAASPQSYTPPLEVCSGMPLATPSSDTSPCADSSTRCPKCEAATRRAALTADEGGAQSWPMREDRGAWKMRPREGRE
jgi:hypothetical protein